MLTTKTIVSKAVHLMNDIDKFLTTTSCDWGIHEVEKQTRETGVNFQMVDYVCKDCKVKIKGGLEPIEQAEA